ncbi:beta-galactosidase [Singulisphaera sp. Ch08]|uniref:Beta-galactosidase n=1 Tax=Singulisphaera sp. Ch08 TaxID=3120278 RepID=A0AAU7CCG4_9BACT
MKHLSVSARFSPWSRLPRSGTDRCGRTMVALGLIRLMAIAALAEEPTDLTLGPHSIVMNQARISADPKRGLDETVPLEVTFLPADWPNLTVKAAKPWDWSRVGRLLLSLKNPGPEPIEFGIRVDDDPRADGTVHCRTAESSIGPRQSATYAIELGREAMSFGMRGLPGRAGARSLTPTGIGPFNLGHIVGFQLYLHRPKTPQTLILSHVRLAPEPSLDGIVDRLGQYAKAEWPGKLHREADFEQRRTRELTDLKEHPALPDRDRFGGWRDGPQLRATGYFRAEKVKQTWWLVDPDGSLFFSSGVDEVRIDFPTFVTGRRTMFAWLPDREDPLARFLGVSQDVHSGPVQEGQTFDFYQANLARKYGPHFIAEWKATTLRRLPSWGFNTFGNWSDRFTRNGRIPYVASATIRGDHARISSGSDDWGKMHDPFDPRFAASVESSLREAISEVKGDAWCLGYFVDNELSWGDSRAVGDAHRYGLALGTLEQSGKSPAKQAFLAQLKQTYGPVEVERLNAAWGTTFANWTDLEASWKPNAPFNPMLKSDLSRFLRHYARVYFQTVRDQIKRKDPNHLYLGCRFARYTPEAVEAAAELCDVVSFNIYAPRIDPKEWGFLNDLERPTLIGEFHIGALDRGLFHGGLVTAPDQKWRGAMFQDYVGSVLDHPSIVGCHWFEYVDEPLIGRTFDGENYAIGIVSVTDTPYPELVAAARSIHRSAYPRRFNAKGKPGAPPTAPETR